MDIQKCILLIHMMWILYKSLLDYMGYVMQVFISCFILGSWSVLKVPKLFPKSNITFIPKPGKENTDQRTKGQFHL